MQSYSPNNKKFQIWGGGGQCLFKHRWSGIQHEEIDPFSLKFSPVAWIFEEQNQAPRRKDGSYVGN